MIKCSHKNNSINISNKTNILYYQYDHYKKNGDNLFSQTDYRHLY
nr:MAG TPA: hypothetical protein [Crassvirales sp.]